MALASSPAPRPATRASLVARASSRSAPPRAAVLARAISAPEPRTSPRASAPLAARGHHHHGARSGAFDALVFDLDGVLYPAENGYMAHVRSNATRFIAERFGLPHDAAEDLRRRAFANANQTVKGLRDLGYPVDAADFADFCRQGEDRFLFEDDDVITAVAALSARYGGRALGDAIGGPARGEDEEKERRREDDPDVVAETDPVGEGKTTRRVAKKMVVMTNASEARAAIALKRLGLDGYFHRVYGAEFMYPRAKPERAAFEAVLADLGLAEAPGRAVMFEDSPKNLAAAKAMGMRCVLVGGATLREEEGADEAVLAHSADAVVRAPLKLAELVRAAPELWR